MTPPSAYSSSSRVLVRRSLPHDCPVTVGLVTMGIVIGSIAIPFTSPATASTTRWETLQMPVELAADAANWEQFPAVVAMLPAGIHADLVGGHTRSAWVGRLGSARLIAGSTQSGEIRLGFARGEAQSAAGVQLWGDVQPGEEGETEEWSAQYLIRDEQRSIGAGGAFGLRISGGSAAAIDLAVDAGIHRRSAKYESQSPDARYRAKARSAASFRVALGAERGIASGVGRLVLQTDRVDDRASVTEREGAALPPVSLIGFYFREHAFLAGWRSVERPHGVVHVSISVRDWEKADRRERRYNRWFEESETEARASIGVESRVGRACLLRVGVSESFAKTRRATDPNVLTPTPRHVRRVEGFYAGRAQIGAEFALGDVLLDLSLETERLFSRGVAGLSLRWSR